MGYGNKKITEIAQTVRYPSILNLDKYDVFSNKGRKHFSVSGIENQIFGLGKHTFGISLRNPSDSQYNLKQSGQIIVELKDANYTTIFSESTLAPITS